ncbi:MAG TPA: hypothetical protein VFJ22_03145 [Dermatophilaceae bacterium]|jgi:pimeloyl-ACP methyl ester carboxylesterase|nr:hypothetical protein [Dermatophilaceae bacterium]
MTTLPAPEKPSANHLRPLSAPSSRRRRRHWLRWLILTVVVLLLVVVGGGGWYLAGQIDSGAFASTPAQPIPAYDDVQVVAVDGGTVTLKKGPDAGENFDAVAKYAMAWAGGFGQVGPASRNADGTVTRSLAVASGAAPKPGQLAGIDRSYWLGDPTTAMGVAKRDITIGQNPAWYFPNGTTNPETIAIFVHGQNGIRENGLRFEDVARRNAMPVLDITYRNDVGASKGSSPRLGYGATEWPDLDAAVAWALGRGAKDVVLVGQSMGSGIVSAFLENSSRAGAVSAIVLDAPMLSLPESIKWGARGALPGGLTPPDPLLWVGERIISLRSGVDWGSIDYLDDTSWLRVPTLITHGTTDPRVPVSESRQLRDAKPGLVKLVEFPNALHTESWNFDSARYTQVVGDFIAPYAK